MKKLFFTLFIVAAAVTGCTTISATDYNNKIIDEQSKIINEVLEFSGKIESGDFKAANDLLTKTSIQCDSSIKVVEAMEPYKGDSEFRDTALELFKFYKRIFSKDYKELMAVLLSEAPTMDDLAKVDGIVKNVETEEKVLDAKVEAAQKQFAEKYDVKVVDNDLQKKIDNVKQ